VNLEDLTLRQRVLLDEALRAHAESRRSLAKMVQSDWLRREYLDDAQRLEQLADVIPGRA